MNENDENKKPPPTASAMAPICHSASKAAEARPPTSLLLHTKGMMNPACQQAESALPLQLDSQQFFEETAGSSAAACCGKCVGGDRKKVRIVGRLHGRWCGRKKGELAACR
jgi:hypothetical protein